MSIGAHAIADKLAIDARPALTGMLVFFKYQCARAFAQYKAVAVTVPRAGSCGWIVVAGGKRTHGGKAAYAQRSEEHTSELQSLMRISYAVFCLKKKKRRINKSAEHNEDK